LAGGNSGNDELVALGVPSGGGAATLRGGKLPTGSFLILEQRTTRAAAGRV